jgi:hypothetical protein
MALSPNYQWAEPDNSSLVKNGAQDIRALGDAIDTSLWNVGYGQAGKNKIINGDFGIWQRGTSFTLAGSGANNYTADRFNAQFDGTGATCTVSQQAFTAGTAPVAGYEGQFFARWNRSAAGTSNTLNYYKQPIEDVRTFAGQPVTLSFWAKADAARSLSAQIYQEFGSGGSGAVLALNGTVSVTTSWQRFTISATLPSITGKTVGTGNSLTVYFIMPTGVAFTFDYWGVQLEYGSKATPFETASGTIEGELALCQRYYNAPSLTPSALMIYSGSSSGGFSANAYSNYLFPVQMRTTPTVTFYAHDGSAGQVTLYVSSTAIKSTSVASIGLQPFGWTGNFSGTGWGTNADSGLLAFGYKAEAEL